MLGLSTAFRELGGGGSDSHLPAAGPRRHPETLPSSSPVAVEIGQDHIKPWKLGVCLPITVITYLGRLQNHTLLIGTLSLASTAV